MEQVNHEEIKALRELVQLQDEQILYLKKTIDQMAVLHAEDVAVLKNEISNMVNRVMMGMNPDA